MMRPNGLLLLLVTLLLVQPSLSGATQEEGLAGALPDLETQIGQMIMVGFRGLEVDAQNPIVSDIRDRKIGGVILFEYDVPAKVAQRNIASPEQVRTLVSQLQDAASIPLFVAIDQEGGRVNRLKDKYGFPPSVSAQFLGTRNDLELTAEHARSTAETLKRLGININFAPSVDVNVNSENPVIGKIERSFSADPTIVTRHAQVWVREHTREGVLSALKHFPGHGSSKADSHLGFVDVTETWSDTELEPYRALISAGECEIVMSAHIFNGNLDPDLPATLSARVLIGILRNQLGFQGLIVSDDLQMKAISAHYGLKTALAHGINAGLDLLVFGNNASEFEPDIATRAIEKIKELVEEGTVSRERIRESYLRIRELKSKIQYR